MSQRMNKNSALKALLRLDAVIGERTVSQVDVDHRAHSKMTYQWKQSSFEEVAAIFKRGGKGDMVAKVAAETVPVLETKIGVRTIVSDYFFKKAPVLDRQVQRGMIEWTHPKLVLGASLVSYLFYNIIYFRDIGPCLFLD